MSVSPLVKIKASKASELREREISAERVVVMNKIRVQSESDIDIRIDIDRYMCVRCVMIRVFSL